MKRARLHTNVLRQILSLWAITLALWAVLRPVQAAHAQSGVDPWDVSWLPTGRSGERAVDQAIDALLQETGLHGQGKTIRENAQRHGVNPAFALALFRQEAGFAARGTLAHRNKNPANIVATGTCWGAPTGTRCKGMYGEVSTDGRFGRYARMEDGIEAFFLLMEREYAGMTLPALINRACPPVECDVAGYVSAMEEWTLEYQALLLDTSQPPSKTARPVLLARLWTTWKRLYPFCCGGGVLILVLGLLAIIYRDRLPLQ